jgi:hypothetical protein
MKIRALAAGTGVAGGFMIMYGTVIQGSPGMMFFAVGLSTLLIVPVTALLCRHPMKSGKEPSYGTAVMGAYGAVLLTFCVTLCRIARFESWTPEYWAALFIGFVLGGAFYVLPAFGVVHCCQTQTVKTKR